ncbi:MAG: toll/interleukin-1 receptor domain-containing protein, partial [Ardenticatenaceae bacterium]|nr:toll/interleukin-1 receptor domain-containing protein [Ardenticatenaceae bacterium]
MVIGTAELRKFLLEKLSDQEFNAFCFDYFRDPYHDFTDTMRRSQKVQGLLAYCERHNKIPDLRVALQREFPDQFRQQFHTGSEVPLFPTSFMRNPRQIFISHAHQDAEFAHKIARDLQQDGWDIWIAPDSIKPGEKWGEAIDRGLEESGIFVLLITKAAVHSRWVRDETYVAIEMEKKGEIGFIPLLLESVKLPGTWRVYQHIPFARNYQNGLVQLMAELEQRPYVPPPPPPSQRQKVMAFLAQVPMMVWGGVGILVLGIVLVAWLLPLIGGGGGDTTREPEATLATEVAVADTATPTATTDPSIPPANAS